MPVYEYQCEECSEEFEELVMNRAAERDVVCKKCGSGNVVKLLSGSTIKTAAGSSASSSIGRPRGCGGGGCGCH